MAPCTCIAVHLALSPWVAPGPVCPLVVLVAVLRLCGSEAVPPLGEPWDLFPQGAAGALAVAELNHLMCV